MWVLKPETGGTVEFLVLIKWPHAIKKSLKKITGFIIVSPNSLG